MSDLISRADAIEAVAEEWLSEASAESPYVNDEDIDKYRELAEDLFSDIPSADAVQGEWQPSSIKSDMWHCSVCGSPLMTDDINETHFCPNCGARMKGGDAKMETEPPKPVHPLYMQQSRHDDGGMTREEAKEILTHNWTRVDNPNYSESELDEAFFMAIEALSAEPNKAVPPSLADVYKWERDIALSQLEEYGIGFAEKKRDDLVEVVRCKDCRWQEECSQLITLHKFYGVYQEISFCSHGERREP